MKLVGRIYKTLSFNTQITSLRHYFLFGEGGLMLIKVRNFLRRLSETLCPI